MIGIGISLIVLGLALLFVEPWVGIAVGSFGLVLAVLWIGGFTVPSMGREAHRHRA